MVIFWVERVVIHKNVRTFFKNPEEGKNVRKISFRRSEKMLENGPKNVKMTVFFGHAGFDELFRILR